MPTLAFSTPGDHQEQHAQRMSAQVLRASASSQALKSAGPALHIFPEPGQPLDQTTRAFMEPRFGFDFGSVRIHTSPLADTAAAAVDARAFTIGTDVVFRRNEFAPQLRAGRALLAHELTHVTEARTGEPRLYRKETIEPHYPTEDEQRKIEEILSREFKGGAAAVPTPAAPGQPVKQRGLALNQAQVQQLAADLKDPYIATIEGLGSGGAESGEPALDEEEGFKVVAEAREAVYKTYGDYAKQLTLTKDENTTPGQRKQRNQVLVQLKVDESIARSLARTVATTHCRECLPKLAPLDDPSRTAVIQKLVEFAFKDVGLEKLQRIAQARVPGGFTRDLQRLRMRLKPRSEFYHTAIHEFIHALAHPVFFAAFGDKDYIDEGFTEYFAQEIVGGVNPSYKDQYEKIVSLRNAMSGPFLLGSVSAESAEESLRLAYFRGRIDLIGWKASGPEEMKAVKEAADPKEPEPKEWDAATAGRYATIYEQQAQAKQAARRHVLGVGLYFAKGTADGTISVRYARVIARSAPYARGQLLLEGQLLGSPTQNPGRLGASLGIAAEYQEPHFYAQGGLRLVGTAIPGGSATELDASVFAGAGIRAWRGIRVGVEGFVAMPLKGGQGTDFGAGLTLGVELK